MPLIGLCVCDDKKIPSAAEVALWHVALHLEQDSLVAKIFLERQSTSDEALAAVVAALQRSRLVYDPHGRDVCGRTRRLSLLGLAERFESEGGERGDSQYLGTWTVLSSLVPRPSRCTQVRFSPSCRARLKRYVSRLLST